VPTAGIYPEKGLSRTGMISRIYPLEINVPGNIKNSRPADIPIQATYSKNFLHLSPARSNLIFQPGRKAVSLNGGIDAPLKNKSRAINILFISEHFADYG
jgi:hypothetical protein